MMMQERISGKSNNMRLTILVGIAAAASVVIAGIAVVRFWEERSAVAAADQAVADHSKCLGLMRDFIAHKGPAPMLCFGVVSDQEIAGLKNQYAKENHLSKQDWTASDVRELLSK